MVNLITDPHFWLLVGLYWIFNAAVGALEPPTEPPTPANARYRFIYKFLHTMAGNMTTAFGNKIPGNVRLTNDKDV